METIQVVLDAALLRATDRAARRARVNRSALVRQALRDFLKRLETRKLEARDRAGYREHSESSTDTSNWERVAAWPERQELRVAAARYDGPSGKGVIGVGRLASGIPDLGSNKKHSQGFGR